MLEAASVASGQAVEHYEMCRCGALIAWAEELGHDEIVRFLTNLNEEGGEHQVEFSGAAPGVNAKASTAA